MEVWFKKWRVKINRNKSAHTTFILKPGICPNVTLNNLPNSTSGTVRNLGLNLDKRLTWSNHIKTRKLTLNARMRMLRPILGISKFTYLRRKLKIYKSLLESIWTYDLQLWATAKITNLNKIHTFRNSSLRKNISITLIYVFNFILRQDFPIVQEASLSYKRFHNWLHNQTNPLINGLSTVTLLVDPLRKLKKSVTILKALSYIYKKKNLTN